MTSRTLRVDDVYGGKQYNTVYTPSEWMEVFTPSQRAALDAGEVISFGNGPNFVDLDAFFNAHNQQTKTAPDVFYDIRISDEQRLMFTRALESYSRYPGLPQITMGEYYLLIDMLRQVERGGTLNDFTL